MPDPSISVVIPLYNKEKYICKSLESVLSQTYSPHEVIIVNDGSKDNSIDVLTDFLDSRFFENCVKIVDQNNKGVSSARNLGARYATGDYVAFLDADDIWDRSFIEKMVRLICTHRGFAIYSCGHVVNKLSSGTYSYKCYGKEVQEFSREAFSRVMSRCSLVNSSKVIIDKSLFFEIGGFPEGIKYGEDLYVWLRLMQKYRLCYLPDALVTINQDFDPERANRNSQVIYPLIYFSDERSMLVNSEKIYLNKIFFRSFFVKLASGDCGAALRTVHYYSKIRGKRAFLYLPLVLLPSFIYRYFYKILW
ncbi:MAG: glycosyltransferase family A protein [Marinobacter sp.]|uniref:glycosyltransferase family 2 protein n=1 Tax=Marinobacter sp. TaxID=50741 RepID=UPI00329733A8